MDNLWQWYVILEKRKIFESDIQTWCVGQIYHRLLRFSSLLSLSRYDYYRQTGLLMLLVSVTFEIWQWYSGDIGQVHRLLLLLYCILDCWVQCNVPGSRDLLFEMPLIKDRTLMMKMMNMITIKKFWLDISSHSETLFDKLFNKF